MHEGFLGERTIDGRAFFIQRKASHWLWQKGAFVSHAKHPISFLSPFAFWLQLLRLD